MFWRRKKSKVESRKSKVGSRKSEVGSSYNGCVGDPVVRRPACVPGVRLSRVGTGETFASPDDSPALTVI